MKQRLKKIYREQVVCNIREMFHYKNVHEIPNLKKLVVSRGLGEDAGNPHLIISSLLELALITRQFGKITRSRNSIAGFKVRAKIPIGLIVTLRCDRIYAFFDRLINLAFPRIRDFQGIKSRGFDGKGNYSVGFEEQLIFPEICYDKIDRLQGIDISIVTTSSTDTERFALLKNIGRPFQ